ncbi:AlpA family transcriptional regulator [Paraburkholderia tropica]|uniref:AlpA family transcriptional regulator n=1 Tax=Paraburkholderia tropica TaxID=92647 RepID=A0ABX5MQB4_9BURK|nr:transcriptional regulator [Paraburkholderia tropica]PXX15873.1 AlpA family transcriptional regulator [Paraburkholderia tropica]PZW82132.1 AlpA family transcriptional regulator [Paraburkholderia tropica]
MSKTSEKAGSGQPSVPILPQIGFSKWAQIAPFLPIGRETWRKLVIAGRAPQPLRLSKTCVAYPNAEVHRWLADPVGYAAASEPQQAA